MKAADIKTSDLLSRKEQNEVTTIMLPVKWKRKACEALTGYKILSTCKYAYHVWATLYV